MDDNNFERGLVQVNTADARVLTCNGSYDTKINTGAEYATISWGEILEMAASPASAVKKLAPAMVPSTYNGHDGRAHEVQRQRGGYIYLVSDHDRGNVALPDLVAAVHEVTNGQALDLVIYSTSSATPENQKWRTVTRLSEPIQGTDYAETAEAYFDLLEERGIPCDRSLARSGQLCYLPNVPPERRGADGSPFHYVHHVERADLGGQGLVLERTLIPAQLAKRKVDREAKQAKANAEAAARSLARKESRTASVSTIEAYNARHEIGELLAEYGYNADGRGGWQSPYQQSGSFATKVFGEYWVSLSGSDAEAGLGMATRSGHRAGDAFDLFVHYAHGGDVRAALQAASIESAIEDFEAVTGTGDDQKGEDEALSQARRERQREENRAIGEEIPPAVMPEIMMPNEMLERFAFAHHGSVVVDLQNPMVAYALPDFRNLTAASRLKIEEKEVPVAGLWMKSHQRITVASRTFRPGHGRFTEDPDGRRCVNTWTPVGRALPSPLFAEHVAMFEDHVTYLFGADACRFLDWLSHLEQKPQELPHVAWLHIAGATGVGRNWMAGVLTRIWKGRTAASFNLTSTLTTGFNAQLSNKLLAIVDEVREGGRDDAWAHGEALKTLVTQETRLINEKYGRQWTEYNCCRLLLFSNHWNALPLDDTDRRFEVAAWSGIKRPPSYYRKLYDVLHEQDFIQDVARWLSERNISAYNPGAHAAYSAAKKILVDGQTSEPKSYGIALRDHWPPDLISCERLTSVIDPRATSGMTATVRNVALECGMRPFTRRVRVNGVPTRLYSIRNHAKWESAPGKAIAAEVVRGIPTNYDLSFSWREYLDGLQSE